MVPVFAIQRLLAQDATDAQMVVMIFLCAKVKTVNWHNEFHQILEENCEN